MDEILKEIEELKKLINQSHKEVFDARGAADYLCVGYDTILRLARIGRIEYVKNGKSYIFKKEYLDRWLDKNKVRSL